MGKNDEEKYLFKLIEDVTDWSLEKDFYYELYGANIEENRYFNNRTIKIILEYINFSDIDIINEYWRCLNNLYIYKSRWEDLKYKITICDYCIRSFILSSIILFRNLTNDYDLKEEDILKDVEKIKKYIKFIHEHLDGYVLCYENDIPLFF